MKARIVKDRLFFWAVCVLSALTAVPLVVIIWEVVKKGYKQINLSFFTETAPSTLDAMLAKTTGELIPGGIANGITGTLLMVAIASAIAIPVGIMGGIYLSEKPKALFSNVVRFLTDLLQGTPSIVIGIIAYAWVVKPLGSYSALAGSVALAIMMRNAEDAPDKPERSRVGIGRVVHERHPARAGAFGIRGLVYRHFTRHLARDGGNRPADAHCVGEHCHQLGRHAADQCCAVADLGILQRPEPDRHDLELVAFLADAHFGAQHHCQAHCKEMANRINKPI